ncbi:hypothetical protein SLS63_003007 [Diaporthe eres]|uniref:Non-haem dioxygenase N-terminal domain-containing protein n=1 Tax=Diaporthe eres TaxID=83184 RepID=A0ABR1PI29_DIAER
MATTTETVTLPYVQAPETSADLDWADLATLDLSKFDQPGFFYVSNHGLTPTEIDTQFALAHSVLSLPDSSKAPYRAALEQGDYNGWKPAGTRNLIPGVKDNFEIYNIPKFIPSHAGRPHPDVVRQHWGTIRAFSERVHEQIVKKLLVVFAVVLGLEDEEWFLKRHRYEENSGDHLRYMKYHARSDEENQKLGGVWLKGIHRVVAPPKDQAHINRLGVLYMVRIEDETDLVPIEESPVLQERGLLGEKILGSDGKPVKAGEWVKNRVIKNLGESRDKEGGDNEVSDIEIVKGVKVKYFD